MKTFYDECDALTEAVHDFAHEVLRALRIDKLAAWLSRKLSR